MKHSISELYRIEGRNGVYSLDYLEANEITIPKRFRDLCEGQGWPINSLQRPGGILKVTTTKGIIVRYMFGEKTFFDTVEELEEAKTEYQARRALSARRTTALKKLKGLSTEELEKLVEKLGL